MYYTNADALHPVFLGLWSGRREPESII